MIIRFSKYIGRYRVLSFAKDAKTCESLENEELPYLTTRGNKAVIFPGAEEFDITPEEFESLDNCCNFDVFELDERGFAYKCFDNSSNDNAILVTNKCNSNCIMCPTAEIVRKKDTNITADRLIEIASHFPKDAPHITITGGEPFLIKKEIFRLFSYLKESFLCTDFLLLTNGRAFASEEYASLLHDSLPNYTIVGIPIHGHIPELHDYITQSKGSFNQTISGIKKLLSKKINVELRIVVSKINAPYIRDISKLVVKEIPEVYCVKIMAMEMTGNAAKNAEKVWIDYSEAFKSSKDAVDILVSKGINVGLYNFPLCTVNKQYWSICEKSISGNKIRFAPQCENCSVKDACGGVFFGTIRFLKDTLDPVI